MMEYKAENNYRFLFIKLIDLAKQGTRWRHGPGRAKKYLISSISTVEAVPRYEASFRYIVAEERRG